MVRSLKGDVKVEFQRAVDLLTLDFEASVEERRDETLADIWLPVRPVATSADYRLFTECGALDDNQYGFSVAEVEAVQETDFAGPAVQALGQHG